MKKHLRRTFLWFIFPSFAGVIILMFVPFLDVIKRSFTTVMGGEFVGLSNYLLIMDNPAFRLAIKNTLKFSVTAITILLILGLIISLLLNRLSDTRVIRSLYLFPMAIPTATVVIVWRMFFYKQDFTSLVSSFIWKNIGITIVLFTAGIVSISRELIEAAKVDGADTFQILLYVKLPCLKGTIFTVLVLSLLNSFKIYREAYLVAGSYPKQEIYLIQHIFSNWYVNLAMDKLSAASVLLIVVLTLFIIMAMRVLLRKN